MVKKNARRIGLGIVGAGRVGLFRAEVAARHPQVDFIGLAEVKPDRARFVAEKVGADFVTSDYRELFTRPELTAAIIATAVSAHRETAGHRARRVGACSQGDWGVGRRCRGRVYAAVPSPLAGGEGESPDRPARRGNVGDITG